MKILIVGPDTKTTRWFYDILKAAHPGVEIVRQDALPDPGEGQQVTGAWIDEAADFRPTGKDLVEKAMSHVEVYNFSKLEKVMHPWSRRKKR